MQVWKFSITLALALFIAAAGPSLAALSVTPALVELDLKNGQGSGSFVVANTGKTPLRVRATNIHFKVDQSGKLGPAKIDSTSLSNWLKVSPPEFLIQPGGNRQVRFGVSVPAGTSDGSYWGGLEFRPIIERDTSAQSQIHAVMAVMVPVLADLGDPTFQWELVEDSMFARAAPKGMTVFTLMRGLGNGRIPHRGQFTLTDDAGTVVFQGETARLSLFPGSQRYFPAVIPPEVAPGQYQFSITYTSERDNTTLSGTTRVEIPEALPEGDQRDNTEPGEEKP